MKLMLLLGLGLVFGTIPIEQENQEKIVFLRDQNIWVIDPDGKNEKQLTSFKGDRDDPGTYGFSFSHDGTKIAFVLSDYPKDKKTGIYVIDIDGKNLARLTDYYCYALDWSPDSKKISFFCHKMGSPGRIHLIEVDSKKVKKLGDPKMISKPFWSPDSKKLVYGYYDPKKEKSGIYVIDADGKNEQKLSDEDGFYFSWSPDGKLITFLIGSSIWVMDADGKNAKELATPPKDYWYQVPRFSPDGKKILFSSRGTKFLSGKPWNIWVMDTDGGNKTELSNGVGSWSPDGKQIVFTKFISDINSKDVAIYIMDADGKNPRKLTEGKSAVWRSTPNKKEETK